MFSPFLTFQDFLELFSCVFLHMSHVKNIEEIKDNDELVQLARD